MFDSGGEVDRDTCAVPVWSDLDVSGVDPGTDAQAHDCESIDEVAAEPFEWVLANIYGDILLRVAEALVARTRPGGMLLLSGILHQDDFEVRERYQELGGAVLRRRSLEEFTTVLLRNAG